MQALRVAANRGAALAATDIADLAYRPNADLRTPEKGRGPAEAKPWKYLVGRVGLTSATSGYSARSLRRQNGTHRQATTVWGWRVRLFPQRSHRSHLPSVDLRDAHAGPPKSGGLFCATSRLHDRATTTGRPFPATRTPAG